MRTKGTVLVTDADRGSAVSIIRSLGRSGWRVIAGDSSPRALGFRSRYCADRFVYPNPLTEAHRFVDAVQRAVAEREVTLLVPLTDEVICPLVGARDRFVDTCQLAVAETESLESTRNKSETLALAQKLEIPVPPTRIVRTIEDAREAAESLRWPLVVKPSVSRRFDVERGIVETCSVGYAHGPEQLDEQMLAFGGRLDVLLQEYCEGVGHGVEILAHEGHVLAAFEHKRLAEIPVSGGASAWRQSVPLDSVRLDYATRLAKALRWTGLMMVEFKVASDSRLMEINGRVWGSLPLAVLSGMDFPSRLAELYVFGPPPRGNAPQDTRYRVGLCAYNLDLMIKWILQVLLGRKRYGFLPFPRRRVALRATLALLSPWQKWDLGSFNDWRPAVAELYKIVRSLTAKVKRTRANGERVDSELLS